MMDNKCRVNENLFIMRVYGGVGARKILYHIVTTVVT